MDIERNTIIDYVRTSQRNSFVNLISKNNLIFDGDMEDDELRIFMFNSINKYIKFQVPANFKNMTGEERTTVIYSNELFEVNCFKLKRAYVCSGKRIK